MENNSSQDFNRKGLEAFGHGRVDDALLFFTKALELDPASAEVRNNRAICFRQLGKLENALSDASEAVRLNGRESLYHSTRGSILTKLKRHADSIEEFDLALELSPLHPEYLLNKVIALRKNGQVTEALETINKIPSPDNTNPEVLIYKGIILFDLKNFGAATPIFRALRNSPQGKIAEHYLGLMNQ